MTCFLFTFVVTTVFWLALMGYGLRKVLIHMKSPEAAEAITKHVLTPLFCKVDGTIINLKIAPSEDESPFVEEDKS